MRNTGQAIHDFYASMAKYECRKPIQRITLKPSIYDTFLFSLHDSDANIVPIEYDITEGLIYMGIEIARGKDDKEN